MLSLDDAIALGLENNLDLAIARYNLPIADTDILRTQGGGTFLGVNLGIVAGTQGGGTLQAPGATGSGAGGTSTGAGGAGAGAGGITGSTLGAGPQIEQFDPTITSTFELEHQVQPQANPLFSGNSATLNNNVTTGDLGYTQGFATGTEIGVTFNNSAADVNNPLDTLKPAINSSLRFQARQHLLQGFGIKNQTRFIRIAKNNKQASQAAFRAQVIFTVSQIQNIYWNLVAAYQDVKAKEQSVELSQKLASDNRKQVQIGTLAPIEIVRADSQVASANQALISSKTSLQLRQLEMINAISHTLVRSTLANLQVIPTDTIEISSSDQDNIPVEDLINQALAQSPSLEEQRLSLANSDISRMSVRNTLLPSLDVTGFYGGAALGGPANPGYVNTFNPGTPNPVKGTGYGDVFGNLFNNSAPDKGVIVTLNIPLRNRQAQATQARSELEYRQAQLLLQQIQNTLSIEVRSSAFSVQQNRAAYEAAMEERRLARESLDAEQKKYNLGASTTYNVLTMINNLATAESNLVTAQSAYAESRVALDQVTANTLKRYNISLGDALEGRVQTMPTVPGVVPAPQTPDTTQTPTTQTPTTPSTTPQNPTPQVPQ